MIPDEILLCIQIIGVVGLAPVLLGAVLLAAYLQLEVFGTKWTVMMILAGLIAWYAVPLAYLWTMSGPLFHELLSDYPVRLHLVTPGLVAYPLVFWLKYELEKRRTRDKGNSDE